MMDKTKDSQGVNPLESLIAEFLTDLVGGKGSRDRHYATCQCGACVIRRYAMNLDRNTTSVSEFDDLAKGQEAVHDVCELIELNAKHYGEPGSQAKISLAAHTADRVGEVTLANAIREFDSAMSKMRQAWLLYDNERIERTAKAEKEYDEAQLAQKTAQ
jgi:hypothetical protein